MIKLFQLLKLCVVLLIGGHCNAQDYQLVWSDEFNKDGCLDESIWNYEQGLLVMRSYNGINLTTLGVRVGCL